MGHICLSKIFLLRGLTLAEHSVLRRLEKQPSHTKVSGARTSLSLPSSSLYATPLTVSPSSSNRVTVACWRVTLHG